ncbi:uncharacterized protein DS421_5g159380 [Arachis hypogaea]|nr:uncharacterized protein DS421_5g159380 [Arachis hypogaea]
MPEQNRRQKPANKETTNWRSRGGAKTVTAVRDVLPRRSAAVDVGHWRWSKNGNAATRRSFLADLLASTSDTGTGTKTAMWRATPSLTDLLASPPAHGNSGTGAEMATIARDVLFCRRHRHLFLPPSSFPCSLVLVRGEARLKLREGPKINLVIEKE